MVDRIEHRQAIFQILKLSKNRMKQQADQHHSQRSFEEGKIIWELEQIIETRTKQLRNQSIIGTSSSGRTYQLHIRHGNTMPPYICIHNYLRAYDNACLKGRGMLIPKC